MFNLLRLLGVLLYDFKGPNLLKAEKELKKIKKASRNNLFS
jgi:hypothetical protein